MKAIFYKRLYDSDDSDIECGYELACDPPPIVAQALFNPKPNWRHKPDGTYDNRPSNPDQHFRDYYHKHRAHKVACCVCQASVTRQCLRRHQRTKWCKRVGEAMARLKASLDVANGLDS